MLVCHMHKFSSPVSVEKLCKTGSFFCIKKLVLFHQLISYSFCRQNSIYSKEAMNDRSDADLIQEELLSKYLRKHIVSDFFMKKERKHSAGNFIMGWKYLSY